MLKFVHINSKSDIIYVDKRFYAKVNGVAVSNSKLWKLLIDKRMKKKDL